MLGDFSLPDGMNRVFFTQWSEVLSSSVVFSQRSCALAGMAGQLCSARAVDQSTYIWPCHFLRLVQLLIWPSVAPREAFQEVQAKLQDFFSPNLKSPEQYFLCILLVNQVNKARSDSRERSLLPPLNERNTKEFIAIFSLPQKQPMEQDSKQCGECKLRAKVKDYP